ncbi:ATP-binding protein [Niameybacter massiliensis]|uniref:ATP-binding protein n=1 Tax=Holtiella tumoricola TaxID=3018743 RepID=A0AA42J2Z4_9FIRM|nr:MULTISPECIES: ATP-binding protein [Lachnospirales]MDA3733711.1 ATP-binding protein [Holtiella tumoricola]
MNLFYKVDGDDFLLAGEASGKVKNILKKLGIDSTKIRKIAVAMYEAEMNMVIHAHGGTIQVDVLPEKIEVILEDKGPGIPDIDLAMQEGYSTATHEIRELGFGAGMGLPNMKKYSDELKITSIVGEGTKVQLTVFLK